MRAVQRATALLGSVLFLLLLCLPAMGVATENLSQEPSRSDTEAAAQASAFDTASTAQELSDWLTAHEAEAGTVKLTADVILDDFTYHRFRGGPAVVDTGAFSLIIRGDVELLCANLTICGDGGDRGVVRVLPGATLSMEHLQVQARWGLALVQEEESGFSGAYCLAPDTQSVFAQTPYVWSYDSALALVAPGTEAADALPETVRGRVNRDGAQPNYAEIPVVWDLDGSEANQQNRLRFTAAGQCPGYAAFAAPQCTVAYDEGPLTFTKVDARETIGAYVIQVDFTKPDRLPITVVQEYSFDGWAWLQYDEIEVQSFGALAYVLDKGPGEESWDTDSCPYLYIRLRWMDGETEYRSNVLRFAAGSLDQVEDIGGNRGGGTEISGGSPPDQNTGISPDTGWDTEPEPESIHAPISVLEPTPEPAPAPNPAPTPAPTRPVQDPPPAPAKPAAPAKSMPALPTQVDRPSPVAIAGADTPPADPPVPTDPAAPAKASAALPTTALAVTPANVPPAAAPGPSPGAVAAGVIATAAALGGAALWLGPKWRGKRRR